MSDFRCVLIEDSRIADITSTEGFGVLSGASQSTFQQFQAVSASNSSIVFNIQVPSENIVIDRHLLLSSTLAFEISAGGTSYPVPVGSKVFQYGLTESLQAFPLNSLFTTTQATINNVSVSTNLQDVLPMLMRMNSSEMLQRYNTLTASLPDQTWGEYQYGVGSNSNPLASYNNMSYDTDFTPRGAFKLDFLQIDRYVSGVFADNSPISTNPLTNTWKIFIKVTLTEPFLALSPFINQQPNMSAGIVGVNNMSMVLNVDSSCKRLFSTANTGVNIGGDGLTGFISGIALGWADAPNGGTAQATGFTNTRLLFNFLSLQPEQYAKISTKNVVPYLDYPRYLTTFNNSVAIASKGTSTITSQSIQLNQVPDLILICARVPMSSQNWNYTSSFLGISKISVNFNNASGLLSTATQQDLYNISFANGSSQSFHEFRGEADVNNNNSGGVSVVPTTGALLVLSPVYNFSLPSYLSASSLGQYQFQFNIDVFNQYDFEVSPELCIVTMNSGIFATQQGTSQIFTGILTKEQVLRTKEQNPQSALTSVEYKRLVGGQLGNMGMGNVLSMIKNMSGMLPSQIKDMMKQAGINIGGATSGGVSSAGKMCGGSISEGGKSKSKLAKHFA
jgi:hypothetical protein